MGSVAAVLFDCRGSGDYGFYAFTDLSANPTPFGDSIFRCTAKDRGERRAKGIAIPLNPLELMFWAILTCFVPTFSQQVLRRD